MKNLIGLGFTAAITFAAWGAQAQDTTSATSATSAACANPGSGGWARVAPLYDPQTVTTLSGDVTSVELTGPRGLGLHLELKTAGGTMAVHLGPAWFLQQQGLQLSVGDQVEITGSRITFEGKPAIIAQTVKKASQAVALRDLQGVPVWAGHNRRR